LVDGPDRNVYEPRVRNSAGEDHSSADALVRNPPLGYQLIERSDADSKSLGLFFAAKCQPLDVGDGGRGGNGITR
jgi:hypothetical protein